MSFNVMIVDDSNSMRAVVKKIITLSGFKMDQCFRLPTKEALELLAGNWVDVIVSDLNMPVMGGLEMLGMLKKDELLKEIPVIVITTEGSNERQENRGRSGCEGIYKKPFLPEDVRRILYEVLGVSDEGNCGADRADADGVDF